MPTRDVGSKLRHGIVNRPLAVMAAVMAPIVAAVPRSSLPDRVAAARMRVASTAAATAHHV